MQARLESRSLSVGLDMSRWLGTRRAKVVVEVVIEMMVDTSELLIHVISLKIVSRWKRKEET